MQRAHIIALLEERFPLSLAEEWDQCGLQVGDENSDCQRVLVALDLDLQHLALLPEVDLVVTHHPLLFRPISRVCAATPLGRKLQALLEHDVALFSLHTPYDVAQGGLGEILAGYLGLTGTKPLLPRGGLVKLVVFVPVGYEERVANALFAAGAGKIGKYGHCSFRTKGTGTFLPEEGARPFLGQVGQEEHVEEIRLETIIPAERVARALKAMRAVHPYEEVAYDLYPLANNPTLHGLGRIGDLPERVSLSQVLQGFAQRLGVDGPRAVVGRWDQEIQRVAVCGGSGGDLVPQAIASGAELYITGEASYHRLKEAEEAGLTVALFGHAETEKPFVSHIAGLLRAECPKVEVMEG
ncbi:MAG: Nif3-like dinuclear metal center hexameric protein [Candidatus Bipolaricaulota bacterium]|nr:Nif3-like dinuclear metal center hexameric protein [Candidatus Bipolaricaulota bacterium]MDW8126764.1 Nif3-like dinuclear metal center hexameric protein [Candidatus Bipolaricaulota bacterium]